MASTFGGRPRRVCETAEEDGEAEEEEVGEDITVDDSSLTTARIMGTEDEEVPFASQLEVPVPSPVPSPVPLSVPVTASAVAASLGCNDATANKRAPTLVATVRSWSAAVARVTATGASSRAATAAVVVSTEGDEKTGVSTVVIGGRGGAGDEWAEFSFCSCCMRCIWRCICFCISSVTTEELPRQF